MLFPPCCCWALAGALAGGVIVTATGAAPAAPAASRSSPRAATTAAQAAPLLGAIHHLQALSLEEAQLGPASKVVQFPCEAGAGVGDNHRDTLCLLPHPRPYLWPRAPRLLSASPLGSAARGQCAVTRLWVVGFE